MTLLLLVRHAVTEATGKRLIGTTPGIHLSENGRNQAARLAECLRAVPLVALYASPLERCIDTALAIADGRSVRVRPVPELEEVGYGRWTGRSLEQLARTALWKRVQQVPSSVRFPEGETLREVQERAVQALDRIAAAHPNGAVAVVSHGDVIRLALAHYAGVHLDLFQRLVVSPASVSAVALGDGVPRIVRVNDTGRMEDLAVRRPARGRRRPGPRAGRP